jgi:hypothetical protein
MAVPQLGHLGLGGILPPPFTLLLLLHRTVEEFVRSFRRIVLHELVKRSQAASECQQKAAFAAWFARSVH